MLFAADLRCDQSRDSADGPDHDQDNPRLPVGLEPSGTVTSALNQFVEMSTLVETLQQRLTRR